MICEKCKLKKATVFYTDNDRTRHSLCAQCAATVKKNGEVVESSPAEDEIIFIPPSCLTENEFDSSIITGDVNAGKYSSKFCQTCKTSASEIKENGYFGCPDCYASFESDKQFSGIIVKYIHSDGMRMPMKQKIRLERRKLISELRTKIKSAVMSEDFETAAELRDKIRSLEKEA